MHFVISGNHHEWGEVLCSLVPLLIVLEYFGFLKTTVIKWVEISIETWSPKCVAKCLCFTVSFNTETRYLCKTDLSKVMSIHYDSASAFNKQNALSLPPQRPYDYAIDLLPEAPLPSCHLCKVSGPKRNTMKKYIEESLASGIINPSTSTLGAGSFFVEKKDKHIHLFLSLNQITIKYKYRYPLPQMDSVFEHLHSSKMFTYLDLKHLSSCLYQRTG